jgi:phenylacetate-coenzyme A ligase PaaK-like adenylate-forming protein
MAPADRRELDELATAIFSIQSSEHFQKIALRVFHLQAKHVSIYRNYCQAMNVVPSAITKCADIPFLPISFFKSHEVVMEGYGANLVFESSGTTGQNTSRHLIHSPDLYLTSALRGFSAAIGDPSNLAILCLLPSYLERESSSLVWMCNQLIKLSKRSESGFYLDQFEELAETLRSLESQGIPTLLLGVSFALIDFADQFPMSLEYTKIMETGGMKGRRVEMTRQELHQHLQSAFQLDSILSEYGMTELLSQAYARSHGRFITSPWMMVKVRSVNDPLEILPAGRTGGINVIDLANLYSCSFIATQDLGQVKEDGSFEVLGRFDFADVRGCNLLVE